MSGLQYTYIRILMRAIPTPDHHPYRVLGYTFHILAIAKNNFSCGTETSIDQRQKKAPPWRYEKERIFGPNDKNKKCLGSDSDMNKICTTSYWRTPRLFYWILSYLWAYNPVNLFLKKTVLIRNAWRNIFETGSSVRTPPI